MPIIIFFFLISTASAQQQSIYKERIAISHDGNLTDCDDIGTSKWNVVYPKDKFTADAMLDLRFLNERFAGEHGFIRQSKNGESFATADGKSIRFWAANVSDQTAKKGMNHLDSMARYLAKIGFNMVRYHGRINPKAEGSKLEEPDSAEIHRIWRFVAAMKKQGIYATISPFWAHNGHMGGHIRKEWGMDGYSEKEALWGAMYFNDKLKNAYKAWVRELYTKPNIYTGIALKDEPAVAIIQIKNEDGVFFWTMQNMNPSLRKIIQQKFANWLTSKYGSLSTAYLQWGNEKVEGDDIANGKVELYNTYEMTINQTGNKAKRLKEQVQFYAETQRNFYKEIHDFYRNELGCKQLINPNNWRTANTPHLDDLERWTNAACEVIATNRYMDQGHVGENSGWQIKAGHYYKSASVLKSPDQLPINVKQIVGKPMLITESGWNMPNKYQVEGPFMISNYQSLNGVDGFYWFSIDDIGINPKPYFNIKSATDSVSKMHRWNLSSPGTVNMMPANALSYRLGYVKQGKTVISENRTKASLFNRELPIINEDTPFDPNRDTEFVKFDKSEKVGITPLAFLVGKVTANYGATKNSSYVSKDLQRLINTNNKRVLSNTGELDLDYGKGIATVNSPYAQGVCGFLNQKRDFTFKTVNITSNNEFASIQVVSMDKKPIAISGKILIQIGTIFLPTNWSDTAAEFTVNKKKVSGLVINDVGTMPWQGQNVNATISIKNPKLTKATLLNAAGYAIEALKIEKSDKGIQLVLPANAMYVIVE
jgi:hypothetical protein